MQFELLIGISFEVLAWKVLEYGRMTAKEKKRMVEEVNILGSLSHENIVKYYTRIIGTQVFDRFPLVLRFQRHFWDKLVAVLSIIVH